MKGMVIIMLKIFVEASGSLTSGYFINSIKEAEHVCVASDIDSECVGRYLADEFIQMPDKDDPGLWDTTSKSLICHGIDIVIPSLDETLLGWAERKSVLMKMGIYVILSEFHTVQIFQDKWLTYQFFVEAGIPTPKTSLEQVFSLVKPRHGRGSAGIKLTMDPICMDGMVSQEFIEGEEYTVDVLCDKDSKPIYIVPRKRLGVKDGKSTGGVVIYHPEIIKWVVRICEKISFQGPINVQCFVCKDGKVKFIEINPRIAGGMALGIAATENWIKLIIDNFINNKSIQPKSIKYGLRMKRDYAEIFIS